MADGPSHTDLSTLWIPLMPETSGLGEAMVKAGQDATESFGKGSEKLGDKITDSFSKSKDKLKDVFHRSGSDAAEAMADSIKQGSSKVEDALGDTGKKASGKFRGAMGDIGKEMVGAISPDIKRQLGSRVEDVVGGAFKSAFGDSGLGKTVGEALGTAANSGVQTWVTDLQKKLGGVKEAVGSTKLAFADLTGGSTAGGVSKLVDNFGKLAPLAHQFGIEITDLPQPVQDMVGKVNAAKTEAQGFADIFKGLPGVIGKVGTAIEGLSGPIMFAIQAGKDYEEWAKANIPGAAGVQAAHGKGMPAYSQSIVDLMNKQPGVHATVPGVGPSGVDLSGVGGLGRGGDVLGSSSDAYDAFSSGAPLPVAPSGSSGLARSWFNSSPRNVGSDQGLTPTSKSVKQVVASLFPQINDIGGWRPPDGYNEHSSGQALDVMVPNASSPQGKALGDQISQYVLAHAKELGVDYTIWQHGQHNPDGSFQMYPDRGGPTQNHMDHVHIHTTRGGGDGTSPSELFASSAGSGTGSAGGGRGSVGMPTGAQHDPMYVTQVSADGNPTGGGSAGDASQQLGSSFLGGMMQSVGLDGSVFKTFGGASNPLDFGATKMATGLLNWGMGMAQSKSGARGMPGMGASVAGAPGMGESPTRGSGGYTNTTNNVSLDNSVTQHGVPGTGVPAWQAVNNSAGRTGPAMAGPAFTGLP